ncbi:MAG: arylesterase [Bdellovibrio sp. CG10_big_fil_rev_8_21_14_0_10_47_8]|nr:MAG: arylesterase [Bdellovibrio sp. CG10_big_fil_rev_8_21_14_0_10_47_8]
MRSLKIYLFIFVLISGLACWGETSASSKRLIILGDSLTEGYGVAKEKAFPALLEKKFQENGKAWIVVNSGVSGSTSASAEQRMRWILKQKPDMILLALGANDGLRGLKPEEMEKNLAKAIELAKSNQVKIVLCGMQMPSNYGASYRKKFTDVFPSLSKKYQIPLIPFLLDKVAGKSEFNQADGIHPNEKGHAIIAETIYSALRGKM